MGGVSYTNLRKCARRCQLRRVISQQPLRIETKGRPFWKLGKQGFIIMLQSRKSRISPWTPPPYRLKDVNRPILRLCEQKICIILTKRAWSADNFGFCTQKICDWQILGLNTDTVEWKYQNIRIENNKYHMRKHASQEVSVPLFPRPPFLTRPPFKANVPGPVPSAHPNFCQPPLFK